MKNIIGIKCKNKYYISEYAPKTNSYKSISELIINNNNPEPTFDPNWCIINNKPTIIQKKTQQPDINYRFELIDEAMTNKKIPLFFSCKDVAEYLGYRWVWKEEYKTLQSLYELCSDKQPDILQDIDFTYKTILEVKEIKKPNEFTYKTPYIINENSIEHQIIDKIIYPNILLNTKPCSLSSFDSYEIIRQYIKQHINYDVAKIKSDYDFCFTVVKKIQLSEPEKYTVNVNNSWFSKRKPKYKTKYKKFREIEIFDMAPKPYQHYRVITGFRGKNQEDLQNNIDNYCKTLIEIINKPYVDCPYCKGAGVILEDNIKKE
mgnify:CR=1 FL=1